MAYGDFDSAAEEVRKMVLRLRNHERFLVYGQYELLGSATADLPVNPELARLEELSRRHPEGIGRWVVKDRHGKVVDEFRPPWD